MRVAILSGIQPVNYHCCINSCIAYTNNYADFDDCPFCDEPRRMSNGQPWRIFSYIPLLPHLQTLCQSPSTIDRLSYRQRYEHKPGWICDVFDSQWYHTLLQKHVVVDGVEQDHTYFSGKHDIALSLAADGFLLFDRRRSGPSATPIILQNLNLPPQSRTHLENIICVGIIPGPSQPKDIASFIAPLDDELADLAMGVKPFDSSDLSHFYLYAFLIFKNGDIVAIEKLLDMKGHNSYCPCRSCKIKGGGKVYYSPLTTPQCEHQTRPSADPRQLQMCTYHHFISVVEKIDSARS
jgi:hypothetical protein